ncbi:uncharacterized protein LOC125075683 [Vanessa atalanta]|uniref:uncharacterized protein LOC125075683 n=1 Tax=Vanessa atalanta TaxID=42275 RepID=UPI001FCE09C5|nr:uncharacterized protein LOC125075683 [Vanessa atalanta]
MSAQDLAAAVLLLLVAKRKRKRTRRWSKDWYLKRPKYTHENLLKDLMLTEENDFKNYVRLDLEQFQELLKLVAQLIEKKNTNMREAIPPFQRLSITLRYLATGNTLEDLKFHSAISPQNLSLIIMETCDAIIKVLNKLIKLPQTAEEWKQVAKDFESQWNAPHVIGAKDGKHVDIKKPPGSGSYYYNYKKTFSIVLMAVVNANYEFIMVDIGTNGRVSDGSVLQNTTFGQQLKNNALNIPPPELLPGSFRKLPYFFVGDDAFPMSQNLLKPYIQTGLTKEKRIYNYRISRARRMVESVFGILGTRFGVFQRAFPFDPTKVRKIVLTCCYLHNFLRKSRSYLSPSLMFREDHESAIIHPPSKEVFQLKPLENINKKNSLNIAKQARDNYNYRES